MLNSLIRVSRPFRYWIGGIQFRRYAETKCLEELRDKFFGKTMLVVGNGPSLNKTPLNDFRSVPSIGMNKIDLIYRKTAWRPDLVVCVNNLVINQNGEQFVNSQVPVFVAWKGRRYLERKWRDHLNYFHLLPTQNFSTDIVQGVGCAATVTYSALQFAYFMGAETVILFGVDHSFVATGKPHQIKKREGADINHFDPDYFKEGSWWGLPDLEGSEVAYSRARRVFEDDGRTIYDATIGGKLDIFPKLSIQEAKQLCGVK